MAEETTKGLFIQKLIDTGYPNTQDKKSNGIIWYKEDSFKDLDKNLAKKFAKASKSLSGTSDGRPDFTIDTDKDCIIVVECKEDIVNHQSVDSLLDYKGGIGTKEDIQKYAINGALHYATFVNDSKDVIAIAISGVKEDNVRITSFVLPKNGNLSDIELIEDGVYDDTIMSIDDYIKIANIQNCRHMLKLQLITLEQTKYQQKIEQGLFRQ